MQINDNTDLAHITYVQWKQELMPYIKKYLLMVYKLALMFFFFLNIEIFIIYYFYPEMWDNVLLQLLHNKDFTINQQSTTEIIYTSTPKKYVLIITLGASIIVGLTTLGGLLLLASKGG